MQNYWSIRINPDLYNCDGPVEIELQKRQYEYWDYKYWRNKTVRIGDEVLVWKGRDGNAQENQGVIALGVVSSEPEMVPDDDRPLNREDNGSILKVKIDYRFPVGLPIWLGNNEAREVLSSLKAAKFPTRHNTVNKETAENWNAVFRILEADKRSEVIEAENLIAEVAGRKSTGQGFLADICSRRAIEDYAMTRAVEHYKELGWQVEDVSSHQSYDLLCVRPGVPELHVEVKGTTTTGEEILLTPNEVTHAQKLFPNVDLLIVHSIRVDMNGTTSVSGGEIKHYRTWCIDDGLLTPVGYKYKPRLEQSGTNES